MDQFDRRVALHPAIQSGSITPLWKLMKLDKNRKFAALDAKLRAWRWLSVPGLCLGLLPGCASDDETPEPGLDGAGGIGGSDFGSATIGTPTSSTLTNTT